MKQRDCWVLLVRMIHWPDRLDYILQEERHRRWKSNVCNFRGPHYNMCDLGHMCAIEIGKDKRYTKRE